jgi:hypothetical protein
MKYAYRVETIHIPEYNGVGESSDEARELMGRRIIHVFSSAPARDGGRTLLALTELEIHL